MWSVTRENFGIVRHSTSALSRALFLSCVIPFDGSFRDQVRSRRIGVTFQLSHHSLQSSRDKLGQF